MRIMAFNGSPRKEWNTGTLLAEVLAGAASRGAETELVHLYDLAFTGCLSCFSCKRLGGRGRGRCAVQDPLTPLLTRAAEADALVLGSPVYLGAETSRARAFIERLCYPYLRYARENRSLFPRRIRTALLFTMNLTAEGLARRGMDRHLGITEEFFQRLFGGVETLYCYDTRQFDDYAKYDNELFDPVHKARQGSEAFPRERRRARELGERLAKGA